MTTLSIGEHAAQSLRVALQDAQALRDRATSAKMPVGRDYALVVTYIEEALLRLNHARSGTPLT